MTIKSNAYSRTSTIRTSFIQHPRFYGIKKLPTCITLIRFIRICKYNAPKLNLISHATTCDDCALRFRSLSLLLQQSDSKDFLFPAQDGVLRQ